TFFSDFENTSLDCGNSRYWIVWFLFTIWLFNSHALLAPAAISSAAYLGVAARVVIPLREPFFDEAVDHNKEIARAHLFDFQLRLPRLSIRPIIRQNRIRVAADDRL